MLSPPLGRRTEPEALKYRDNGNENGNYRDYRDNIKYMSHNQKLFEGGLVVYT